jgi:hypothetical protein
MYNFYPCIYQSLLCNFQINPFLFSEIIFRNYAINKFLFSEIIFRNYAINKFLYYNNYSNNFNF